MASKKKKPTAPVMDLANAVSLPEASRLADVSEGWMRTLVQTGKIMGVKIGRNYLVDRDSAKAFDRHPSVGRPRKDS
jgi:hypothetical protein